METFGKRYHPPGTPPGTLTRHSTSDTTHIRLFEYSDKSFSETPSPTPQQCQDVQQNTLIDWLDVTGVNDPTAIRELGETFGLHPLALEDILNSGQRPKIDFHEQIEALEDRVLENPDKAILNTLHQLKRDLLLLRRALWPQREVISRLLQHDAELVNATLRPYFSDCYDHAVQIIDLIETYREMLSGMLDIYLSSLSNRMNDIMRVLTVVGTIFIPLTFIVGVYGMNFRVMPELAWEYGYFIIWGIMLVLAIGMLAAFKWRNWL